MRARYGLDHRDWPTLTMIGILVAAFLAIIGWIATTSGTSGVQFRLLSWEIISPTQVNISYEVRPPANRTTYCVLRAQDVTRADVGYQIIEIPPGPDYVRQTTTLDTLIPAYTAEILGCALDEPPMVNPPQFPPGVLPPEGNGLPFRS
jgi:hypothetical protein